jgi:hypothetical protein
LKTDVMRMLGCWLEGALETVLSEQVLEPVAGAPDDWMARVPGLPDLAGVGETKSQATTILRGKLREKVWSWVLEAALDQLRREGLVLPGGAVIAHPLNAERGRRNAEQEAGFQPLTVVVAPFPADPVLSHTPGCAYLVLGGVAECGRCRELEEIRKRATELVRVGEAKWGDGGPLRFEQRKGGGA